MTEKENETAPIGKDDAHQTTLSGSESIARAVIDAGASR
jgi:hypothetical protein